MKSLFSNPIDSVVPNNNFAYFPYLKLFQIFQILGVLVLYAKPQQFYFPSQEYRQTSSSCNALTFSPLIKASYCCTASVNVQRQPLSLFLDLLFGLFLYFTFFYFSVFALRPVFQFGYEEQTKQSRIKNFKVTSGTLTNMIRLSTEVSFSDFVFSSKLVKA